ncbi:hypothetical protein [Mesorhizobium sp. L2C067A000]|uniref:hypothetical protein n=1 Tax=Mesorhizobium sp. L2C067A000 TaxID=1287106 RepID=UPI0003CFA73B|nr:hypothetical protein [Mesorhizobium sp. L2C067A000]ESZ31006.1 hypothetical protein X733_22480 [Mesorhizobium sp. L2C067A000]
MTAMEPAPEEESVVLKDGIAYVNWERMRELRFAKNIEPPRPEGWPATVDALSIDGMSLFGIDQNTDELFWDGKRLVTEKRFSDYERRLAWGGLIIAGIGVAATVVQAWAAVASLP